MSSFKFFWTTHKWVGIILAVIFLNIAATGFLLLIKKKVAWIQPIEFRGVAENEIDISFEQVLDAARSSGIGIDTWADVDRLDVRPGKGVVKIRSQENWEAQVDLSTGEVLHTAYRRSDIIESIHDGSYFADWMHEWVWPGVSLFLVFLVFSGFWLWLEPKYRKRKRKKRRASTNAPGVRMTTGG